MPNNATKEKSYFWKLDGWTGKLKFIKQKLSNLLIKLLLTACTATCGGGKKYRIPICLEKEEGNLVYDNFF